MAHRTVTARSKKVKEKVGEVLVATGNILASWTNPGKRGDVQYLPIDDIIKKYGYKEYKAMRHDDQVKAALNFKKVLTYGRSFDLDPADDSKEAKDITRFLKWNLDQLNMTSVLRESLTALDFGMSVGELVWGLGEFEGRTVVMLKAIKYRDPEFMEVKADVHGNVNMWQQRPPYGKPIEIHPSKVFHFAHQEEFQNAYGQSDLRGAYKNWWAKKYIINFWSVHLERMGSPLLATKYPVGASADMKKALKDILANLQSKSEILVPMGVEFEIVEGTKSGQGNFQGALEYHDGAIAKAILVPALLGFGAPTGKGGEGQDRLQLRTLFKVTQQLGNDLAFQLHNQVLKQLIDFNFDHDNLYPAWIWQDYGEFMAAEIADSIRLLHNAGIFDMDQEDVNYARSILGLPLRAEDDEDEVIRPNPAPMGANMPPPPAAQGNDKATKETKGNAE